ncbi:MAG: sterol desaturase family protein [Alphaproteobacteria bacterium]|nr:sterol desaturase family protein [Alphaproteobacteria bacterium]
MQALTDLWIGVQTWIFETLVVPVIYGGGWMAWYEPAFNAVELVMLGCVQIAVIAFGMRAIEKRWPLERTTDERLMRVDVVYSLLNKLGIVPLAVFIAIFPLAQWIELVVRQMGFAPPRIEHLAPWLNDYPLLTFLAYFALYDFAAYWVHRAQHAIPQWWALHSLHHSQRQMTAWTDDRNHILDDTFVAIVMAVFSQMVGVQPADFVMILLVGRLVESWSHANVDVDFGGIGGRLLVSPRFHRLHHALASPDERHIHDHNFAPVFPIWDIMFRTAIYDRKFRPTGVDDRDADRDNGRGWIAQQVGGFGRFLRALVPGFKSA